MRWFLLGSVLISAIILIIFFRSVSATLLSLSVVIIGVIWSMGVMHLCHYNISLLTALVPPLIVVIGIPNCVYFLNKYHTAWLDTRDKHTALVEMVNRMGIITLFCNIAAAIGFAVLHLPKAPYPRIWRGSGISILLFSLSLGVIPAVLSYLPAPKIRHVNTSAGGWMWC